jgi:hypothetical protein
MDKKFICYCGLHCENCGIKTKVEPASKVLYEEMKKMGFEGFIHNMPNGKEFWTFLKYMVEKGVCVSCQSGVGGDPHCAIRICAKEKGIEMCALCNDYPCDNFAMIFKVNPTVKSDNALLHEQGMEQWAKLQDERKAKGFTYPTLHV